LRGSDERTGALFSYVDLEARVPRDHPLRSIRMVVNKALGAMAFVRKFCGGRRCIGDCVGLSAEIAGPQIDTAQDLAKNSGGYTMRAKPTRTTRPAAPKLARSGARAERARPSSLTDQVYARLRHEILTCELEPGRELSEAELAARFSVSKTPVREALATLRQEGFVHTFPRRGYQVIPVTFGDMNELFDVRTILEAGAAELACSRISDAELDQLDRLADVVYDRAEKPSLKRFIEANRDFHEAIARASGNDRLHQLVMRQVLELERFFYLGAKLRDVNTETTSDHHEIVRVLRRRGAVEARQIMIRHNEVTRRGLFEALASSRSHGLISI
jgi:DNA-binding GntR family transcriptional regulator